MDPIFIAYRRVSDPVIVNTGYYIALEGNRRITALKTLMTPDLVHLAFRSWL